MRQGTLGARLRKARKMAGLNVRELARLAGVSEGYPSLVETGARRSIGADVAAKFAHALGLSLEWLVSGEGEPPTKRSIQKAVVAAREKRGSDTPAEGAA